MEQLLQQLISDASTEVERAIRIHDFVRDIPFGFTPYFDAAPPLVTAVSLRRGHCNPKGELAVTLFRLAGLEAHLHAVAIKPDVLRGCIAQAPPVLTHTYSRVLVEGRWCSVDSYVVDPALFAAAKARLLAEGGRIGYGIHVEGTTQWDGRSDAFSQFHSPAEMLHAEIGQVGGMRELMRHPGFTHRLGPLAFATLLAPLRLAPGWFVRAANARVDALRAGGTRAA